MGPAGYFFFWICPPPPTLKRWSKKQWWKNNLIRFTFYPRNRYGRTLVWKIMSYPLPHRFAHWSSNFHHHSNHHLCNRTISEKENNQCPRVIFCFEITEFSILKFFGIFDILCFLLQLILHVQYVTNITASYGGFGLYAIAFDWFLIFGSYWDWISSTFYVFLWCWSVLYILKYLKPFLPEYCVFFVSKMQTPAITLWFPEKCLSGFFFFEKQLASKTVSTFNMY